MDEYSLDEDPFSRKILRYFLVLQIIVLGIVILAIFLKNPQLALIIVLLTFLILAGVLALLYFRYRALPVVQEKHKLEKQISLLKTNISIERKKIREAQRIKEKLYQAEIDELRETLQNLQQEYIQKGLNNTLINSATIPGIGPKLKQRLAEHGILTAANVNNRTTGIEGFGEAKTRSIIEWKASIYSQLENTKPAKLSDDDYKRIIQKYYDLNSKNNTDEVNAKDNETRLENELTSLRPNLKKFGHVTFIAYLTKVLASRKFVAGLLAIFLISTQAISGVSATTASIIAAIPTATLTSTVTLTPTTTLTSTVTLTSTTTLTATLTLTPTYTLAPSMTSTQTPVAIAPTADPLQYVTAICNDGTYSYSAHRQGTCSHHGGVKQWINKPPN
jgi:hypothetical protein